MMKYALLLAALIIAATAYAQTCTPGQTQHYRPQGVTPNYPPSSEAFCRYTNEARNYMSCTLCHYHMWRNAA